MNVFYCVTIHLHPDLLIPYQMVCELSCTPWSLQQSLLLHSFLLRFFLKVYWELYGPNCKLFKICLWDLNSKRSHFFKTLMLKSGYHLCTNKQCLTFSTTVTLPVFAIFAGALNYKQLKAGATSLNYTF